MFHQYPLGGTHASVNAIVIYYFLNFEDVGRKCICYFGYNYIILTYLLHCKKPIHGNHLRLLCNVVQRKMSRFKWLL